MSHKANIACRDAIDEAISRHYENNRLGSGAVRDVVQEFGLERTLYVTANTFRHKDWDGRISRNNKEWAQDFPVVPDINSAGDDRTAEFVANSHPSLLDIFAPMPVADDQGRVVITNALQGFNERTIARLEDFEAHGRDAPFCLPGSGAFTKKSTFPQFLRKEKRL